MQRGKSGMTAKGNGQAERCLGQSRTQSRPVGGTAYRPRPGRGWLDARWGNGQAGRCPGQSRTQSRPVGGTAYRPRPGQGQPTGSKKGTLMLKRPTLLAFGEQEGKEKNSGSQGTKGKTVEKGTLALKRPTLLAFGEQEGKEKTPARREPKARPPKKAR